MSASDLQDLLRAMICPDPAYRITAMQAYHHTALLLSAPSVIITPHFVRMATSFDPEDEPLPSVPKKVSCEKKEKKRHTKRKEANRQSRASTPTALGESIKQHTSMSKLRPSIREGIKGLHLPEAIPSPKRGQLVIKQTKDEQMSDGGREDKENLDPTREFWMRITSSG